MINSFSKELTTCLSYDEKNKKDKNKKKKEGKRKSKKPEPQKLKLVFRIIRLQSLHP